MPLDRAGAVLIAKETHVHARVLRYAEHVCTFVALADSVVTLARLLANALDTDTCGTQEALLWPAFETYRNATRRNNVSLSVFEDKMIVTPGGQLAYAERGTFDIVPLSTPLFDVAAQLYASLDVDIDHRNSLRQWRTLVGPVA